MPGVSAARRAAATVARGEDGFTLTELLVGIGLAIVVLWGVLGLLENSTQLSAATLDRVETTAKTRTAIDMLTRQLRSQVCLGTGQPALTYADDNRMTFYSSLAAESDAQQFQQRTLTYDQTARTISETIQPLSGQRPDLVPSGPPQTRVIVGDVVRDGPRSAFSYFRYSVSAGGTPSLVPITTRPLTATDLGRVVQMGVQVIAQGRRARTRLLISTRVFVRTASPASPDTSPLCI